MPENCAAIIIAAKHHELIKVKDTRGTTNTVGALRCKFQFRTEDWLHSAKTAMFCNGDAVLHPEVIDNAISVPLDADDECPVPYEVLTDTLPYSVGVWGVTDKGLRVVSNWLVFNAQIGCYVEGSIPEEPELTVYEQILQLSKHASNQAEEVVARADSGEFNGKDGQDGYTPVKGVDYFDGIDGKDGADGKDGYTPIKGVDYFDGVNGKDGKDGKDGYTPIKGVDYIEGRDGVDGKDGYTPIKGVDYFDGKDGKDGADGKTPVKGVDYFDGKDGYTPIKGVDYFDGVNGRDGIDGTNGTNGVDGKDGKDGLTPFINGSGNWQIGETDTGVNATVDVDVIISSVIASLPIYNGEVTEI